MYDLDQRDRGAVTLAPNTVHNPDEPRHFMRLKPVNRIVRVCHRGRLVAQSENALRLLEVGKDLYDPVLYFPAADIVAELAPVADKTTHCPLKGDARYFDLIRGGAVAAASIAWFYPEPLGFAERIAGLVAFDAARVVITEEARGA